ncbi:hypothetical protein ELS24_20930 [Achromobacter spanius]|uniref:Uncharacterized protein n=1 Tax=Achromobacter spanius TaxID=217203 RepID=A0A3Q9KJN6_9BURK|nr:MULTISPECIES: hypothetical protein [Achromobacter]AZS80696.1 hypothetical protein ELS24_20930 [Achromobacter spanius]MDH0740192.1 hypothetical protein [Achromobacter spanius]
MALSQCDHVSQNAHGVAQEISVPLRNVYANAGEGFKMQTKIRSRFVGGAILDSDQQGAHMVYVSADFL